jgi:hypothetical protein
MAGFKRRTASRKWPIRHQCLESNRGQAPIPGNPFPPDRPCSLASDRPPCGNLTGQGVRALASSTIDRIHSVKICSLTPISLLPFPILDGGHITLALLEKLRGRPVRARPLEILQAVCAALLVSLMLFVTSKDIGDSFDGPSPRKPEVVFP